jgi:plastocyanin
MRKFAVLAVAAAVTVGALGAAVAPASDAGAKKTVRVGVKGTKFSPKRVSIKRGDSVVWSWSDTGAPHNVVAAAGSARGSGDPVSSDRYKRTLRKKGTFVYYCEVHGSSDGSGMAMKVTVR